MFKKLNQSQAPMINADKQAKWLKLGVKEGRTIINDPVVVHYPLKLSKNRLRKQGEVNATTQTNPNPQKSSIKVYKQANNSRIFKEQSAQDQINTSHSLFLFSSTNNKKIAKSGLCSYLSQQSLKFSPSDTPFTGQSSTKYKKSVEIHQRTNPIVEGQTQSNHNSHLQQTWKQTRKLRDHGSQCQKLMNCPLKLHKRQFPTASRIHTKPNYCPDQMSLIIGNM